MNTILIDSGNSKTSDADRLFLNISGKINMLLCQILAFTIHKNI